MNDEAQLISSNINNKKALRRNVNQFRHKIVWTQIRCNNIYMISIACTFLHQLFGNYQKLNQTMGEIYAHQLVLVIQSLVPYPW
jgi:hypothetical protein